MNFWWWGKSEECWWSNPNDERGSGWTLTHWRGRCLEQKITSEDNWRRPDEEPEHCEVISWGWWPTGLDYWGTDTSNEKKERKTCQIEYASHVLLCIRHRCTSGNDIERSMRINYRRFIFHSHEDNRCKRAHEALSLQLRGLDLSSLRCLWGRFLRLPTVTIELSPLVHLSVNWISCLFVVCRSFLQKLSLIWIIGKKYIGFWQNPNEIA